MGIKSSTLSVSVSPESCWSVWKVWISLTELSESEFTETVHRCLLKVNDPPEPSQGPLEVLDPMLSPNRLKEWRGHTPLGVGVSCEWVCVCREGGGQSRTPWFPYQLFTGGGTGGGRRLPLSEALAQHGDRLGGVGGRPGPDSRK